jgi:hypothetical protein
MLGSFIDEHDLVRQGREVARRGREAREWLTHEEHAREVARRGREVRQWLDRDERRRVVALVILSIAVSVAVSLMATAITAAMRRRCAAAGPSHGTEGETVSGAATEVRGEAGPDAVAAEAPDAPGTSETPEAADGAASAGD